MSYDALLFTVVLVAVLSVYAGSPDEVLLIVLNENSVTPVASSVDEVTSLQISQGAVPVVVASPVSAGVK